MGERYLARGETTGWFTVGRVMMVLGTITGAVIYFVGDPILASSCSPALGC